MLTKYPNLIILISFSIMKRLDRLIISHLYFDQDSKEWVVQSNEEHCKGVSDMASEFAGRIGYGNWGKILGYIHDRGKEKEDFQRYIRIKSGYDCNAGQYNDKSHSITGAAMLDKKYGDPFKIMPNIVAGHHRGLYNRFELDSSLQYDIPEEVSTCIPDIKPEQPKIKAKYLSHLARVLFSCLTDADYLDTERFMNPNDFSSRGNSNTLPELKQRLDDWLLQFKDLPASPINIIRNEIQQLCLDKSNEAPGIYELTVPTGGGKTISSVVWALNHAIEHNKGRIIIAIPYTSIIIQTAKILRDIFGDDNVLEHHSVVSEENMNHKNKLMSENWDAPIVVTTNVQLFESIFSNKPGKCRKLHSICNSVLILDEVQNLPLTFLQPIVEAIEAYTGNFNVSVLLCTASQPCLSGIHKGLGTARFTGLQSHVNPIIPAEMRLHEKLRRVDLKMPTSKETLEDVAKRLCSFPRVLCIVNTRKIALELYQLMPEDGYLIHLSRMMCSKHIQDKLSMLYDLLKPSHDKPIRVISTQLVEAGVDIDFPVVFRQFAGLDSMLQAAGRCNREGKEKNATTYIFEPDGYVAKGNMGASSYAMKELLSLHPDSDWFDPDTMREYFRILYSKTNSFDKEGIIEMYADPRKISFETISEKFHLIDEQETSVIVNYGDAEKWVRLLKENKPSKLLLSKLGIYSVGIRKRTFNELYMKGVIEEIWDGIYYIPLKQQYDENTGLKVSNEYEEQTFVI